MSRSTQWIGLNKLAEEFVERMMEVTMNEPARHTYGMFDEPLRLRTWHHLQSNEYYKEVVQFTPWSSGPMIFTCLEDADGNKLFQWIVDADITNEYNFETGRLWV